MEQVILEVRNIIKKYPSLNKKVEDFMALKDVSFGINKGEIFSLLGVNGAGKSTLSSIIASLHPATSGDILFNSESIYKDIYSYRMNIGYCPQRANLDTYLNVRQNLVFAGRYYLLPESLIKDRVDYLIDSFDLKNYADSKIEVLSGGYKQRVMIARALVHNPDIVILDEPTVALDPHIRRTLWQKIKDLKAEGVTVILTTHYLEEAEALSDRVCILHDGAVKLIDKPENLKTIYQKASLEDVFLQLMSEKPKSE